MRLEDKIPGYRKALAWEEEQRDFAFLDLPRKCCGVELRQITLRQALALINVRSPFLVGGAPRPGHVAQFLWFLSTGYQPADKAARTKFVRKIARKRFARCLREIDDYLDVAFMDSPESRGKSGEAFTSFAASLVDTFAEQYGWSEASILDLPLVRLYQYLRRIERRFDPKARFINSRSTKARGEWMRRREKRRMKKQ